MAQAHRGYALVLACMTGALLPGCSADERAGVPHAVAPASQTALAKKATAGDPDAIAELGRNYMTGASGYPRDAGKAREMFDYAAQRGSGAGLLYLGLLAYEGDGHQGDGHRPDVKAACALFAQSAARGHPAGLREYGECQLRGTGGVAKDARAAAESFRKSIANGGVQAYESLARLYASGEGVQKDPAEAARLRRKLDSVPAGR